MKNLNSHNNWYFEFVYIYSIDRKLTLHPSFMPLNGICMDLNNEIHNIRI